MAEIPPLKLHSSILFVSFTSRDRGGRETYLVFFSALKSNFSLDLGSYRGRCVGAFGVRRWFLLEGFGFTGDECFVWQAL